MGECMKRKIEDSMIDTLVTVLFWFLLLNSSISEIIFLDYAFKGVSPNATGIAFIYFLISAIWFMVYCCSGPSLEFLRKRNDKIDEEEKARQQALLLEAEERIRANSQIWVSE